MKLRLIFSFLILSSVMTSIWGQSRKHFYRKDNYYIGTSLGFGFTQPIIHERYNILEPTLQSAATDFDKKYEGLFQNIGGNYGLHFSFVYTRLFSVVCQPTFQTQRFSYMTNYSWSDSLSGGEVYKEFLHRQKISNLCIPIMGRLDFSSRKFSPFLQAGLSADIVYFGSKIIYSDAYIDGEVDRKSAGHSNVAEITQHLNRFNVSLLAGAGFVYYHEDFALSISGNIKYGMRPTINDSKRFEDFSGFAAPYLDVFDQVKLLNLDFLITAMVPLHKKW